MLFINQFVCSVCTCVWTAVSWSSCWHKIPESKTKCKMMLAWFQIQIHIFIISRLPVTTKINNSSSFTWQVLWAGAASLQSSVGYGHYEGSTTTKKQHKSHHSSDCCLVALWGTFPEWLNRMWLKKVSFVSLFTPSTSQIAISNHWCTNRYLGSRVSQWVESKWMSCSSVLIQDAEFLLVPGLLLVEDLDLWERGQWWRFLNTHKEVYPVCSKAQNCPIEHIL